MWLQQWDVDRVPSRPSGGRGGSPQSLSPALTASLTMQQPLPLVLFSFVSLGFSFLFAFFFSLFSLFSSSHFSFVAFLLLSLPLSPFLLCYSQTKPGSQEQALALRTIGVQQYHGLALLAGTRPLPGGRSSSGACGCLGGSLAGSRCNIRALCPYELLLLCLLASINTLQFCCSKIPRLVTRAGALPNTVGVKCFMETSLVSVDVGSEKQAHLL